ncbi:MAG: mycothiol conjugate amidase Mca [Acidimicrobiales bacterium]
MTDANNRRLCLLSFHAHPDDESSKGSGTVNRYVREGVHCALVCATGGEAGEILNPAMDRPEVRDNLAQVRRAELARAAEIIGFHRVVMLGYRDSGMPGTPANDDPACFARADEVEAVGRLVEVIRQERPTVVITYADGQEGVPHPDHLRVHDVGVAAFDAAGDSDAYPETGPAWRPLKLYYWTWSQTRIRALHEKFLELGLESPITEARLNRRGSDERITTRVHVPNGEEVRRAALLAHATQIDPTSQFWFGLPADVAAYPFEDFILARSDVDSTLPEDDLFAGLRG